LEVLFKNIPSGVGSKSKLKLSDDELNDVLKRGPEWPLKKDMA